MAIAQERSVQGDKPRFDLVQIHNHLEFGINGNLDVIEQDRFNKPNYTCYFWDKLLISICANEMQVTHTTTFGIDNSRTKVLTNNKI